MMAHAPLPCHQACPRGFWGSDFREATVPRGLIRRAPMWQHPNEGAAVAGRSCWGWGLGPQELAALQRRVRARMELQQKLEAAGDQRDQP